MMCTAVIMAGGRSERMRATAGQTHKALVPVLGVPMLERNLLSLLAHGFRDIIVAVSSGERDIVDYVRNRGTVLARLRDAALRCHQEERPLGTVGVAGVLECPSEDLLVINVDNLTTLDLRALVSHHENTGASLTIATHIESFRVPFGEVVVNDGQVIEYREKPTFQVQLSSGTYVLSSHARRLIPKEVFTNLPDLFSMLKQRGASIVSYAHQAAWIDVNDAAARSRADRLINDNFESFEHWKQEPDLQVAELVIISPLGILLQREVGRDGQSRGLTSWRLPVVAIPKGVTPCTSDARLFNKHSPWQTLKPDFLISFDDLNVINGRLVRHYVFMARTVDVQHARFPKTDWFPFEQIASVSETNQALLRCVAVARNAQHESSSPTHS